MINYIIAFICTVIVPIVGLCFILYIFTKRIKASKGKPKLFYAFYSPLLVIWLLGSSISMGFYYAAAIYDCAPLTWKPGFKDNFSIATGHVPSTRLAIHSWFNLPHSPYTPFCEDDLKEWKILQKAYDEKKALEQSSKNTSLSSKTVQDK